MMIAVEMGWGDGVSGMCFDDGADHGVSDVTRSVNRLTSKRSCSISDG